MTDSRQSPSRAFVIMLMIVVLIGGLLRFIHLDRKVYWHDEVTSSYRIAGYRGIELAENLYNGQVISIDEVQFYQRLNPKRGVADVLDSFVIENAQHPPLYYILLHYWAQVWGDSIGALRGLSAVFSIMAFPALYWLCLELFATPLIGWIAMAMMAVSPVHLLYAQEARQYSLWVVAILLSTAALVRAIRLKSWQAWATYTMTVTLGLYTFLFSGLVVIVQGLSLVPLGRRVLRSYGLAVGAAVFLFSPWLWVIINRLEGVQGGTRWTQNPMDVILRASIWRQNISRLLFDWDASIYDPITIICSCLGVGLIIAAGLLFWRQANPFAARLVLLLTGIIPLVTMVPDVLGGGMRSIVARYFMPSYVGLGLMVATVLAMGILQAQKLRQSLWQGLTIAILLSGLVSCLFLLPAQISWSKGSSDPAQFKKIDIINQAARPLVISSILGQSPPNIVSLSYVLDSKVKFQLVLEGVVPTLPTGFSNIFVIDSSETFRTNLLTKYPGELNAMNDDLWELKLNQE